MNQPSRLDYNELRTACHEIALRAMWERLPLDLSNLEPLSEKLFIEARSYEEFITGVSRDPNMIIRAVRYLSYVHAIPPMRDDIIWFTNSMTVLLELACPIINVAHAGAEQLFKDIEDGIADSRSDYTI